MGLSLGGFLKTIGGSIVDAIPGGSTLNKYIDLPGGRGLSGSDVTFNPATGGSSLVAQQPSDSWLIPDPIERMYAPERFPDTAQGAAVGQVPIVVQPGVRQVASAPAGYVIVTCPNGAKKAMLKPVARALGLWKPRRKPPIKVSDWQALMKADRTVKKLKNVTKRAGMIQRARGRK